MAGEMIQKPHFGKRMAFVPNVAENDGLNLTPYTHHGPESNSPMPHDPVDGTFLHLNQSNVASLV